MSWDVYLTDDRGHTEGDWNCTHNINGMVQEALDSAGYGLPEYEGNNIIHKIITQDSGKVAWYDVLNGMDGPTGQKYLKDILDELKSDPVKYEAMNPENGWGDYKGLCEILQEMVDRVPEWPTSWSASG